MAVHINGQRDNNCVRSVAVDVRLATGEVYTGVPVPIAGQHAGWIILPITRTVPVDAMLVLRCASESGRRVRIRGYACFLVSLFAISFYFKRWSSGRAHQSRCAQGLALLRASHSSETALAGSHCLRSVLLAAPVFVIVLDSVVSQAPLIAQSASNAWG